MVDARTVVGDNINMLNLILIIWFLIGLIISSRVRQWGREQYYSINLSYFIGSIMVGMLLVPLYLFMLILRIRF